MPKFQRTNNAEVTGIIDLVQGNTLRLKLAGDVKAGKATHYEIKSSSPLITVSQRANERQKEQLITLEVSETGTARLIRVSARIPASSSEVAFFLVNILPKLALPDFGSEVGIVAHLLLAESLTPNYVADYGNGADVLQAMVLMREVLDNRLSAARTSEALRSYVACNPTSNDLRGIVQANMCGRAVSPQFKGFDGARNAPNRAQLDVIQPLLAQANDGTHRLFEKSRAHVEQAIEIASRPSRISPISDSSLLFWRTYDSDPPSSYAMRQKILADQVFYSLSSGYLKNPQNPEKP